MSLAPSEQRASHTYFDSHFNCQSVKVLPGEYFIGSGDLLIVTVLGSCVSACIQDRQSGIGGMNHFMLPDSADAGEMASLSMRYGACAMEVLINELLKAGARRSNLEAKVFGGGNVLGGSSSINVGKRNGRFVEAYLRTEGIPIVASDLDQTWGRKVLFFPGTGRVLVKKVLMHHNESIVRKEKEYARNLSKTEKSGEVELF